MPELPEVETVRTGLERLIVGRTVSAVSHNTSRSFPNVATEVDQFMVGTTVVAVRRRAKLLLIDLSSEYTLVTHLKMTGQLVFRGDQNFGAGHPNDSLIGELPDKSTRVVISFKDGSRLYFNDQRKFGWMMLYPTVEVPNIDFMKKVGPEPLDESFTPQDFVERFVRRKNTSIKAALLDQTVVAGVGNIYADEVLWGAKLHPATKVFEISVSKFRILFRELQYVLRLAIEKGGSTDRNYVNAEGKKGSYIEFARVFRREGQPCPRCATTIKKIRVASRGTHLCPNCQKL